MTLNDILAQFASQHADFFIESVSTEDRRAIVAELIASPEWALDDWIKSKNNMWRQFSLITGNKLISRTITINDGDDDLFDCICCFF